MNDNSKHQAQKSICNYLITGGTGSLGQMVTEYILDNLEYVDKVMIYSRDEQKQEQMRNKFSSNKNYHKLRFFIGDIRDKSRLSFAVREATHIIHAAALKIVPSIEYNPQECIKTNIIGAQNLIETCAENVGFSTCAENVGFSSKQVLAISTDKAVHPINLYGATKLAAEKLFIDANNISGNNSFSVARYGNVTGSRGSVVPFFKECLDKNEPLPITDPNMTRFWITLEDAAWFVIRRSRFMHGGEIFIPEMKSYKITDLAEILIEDKFGPEKQYPTMIVGLRAGEKIHEDLISQHEFEHVYDCDGYVEILRKQNQHYKELLAEAHLTGIPIKNSYNSSMFLMSKEELKTQMLISGMIDVPYPENVYTKEENIDVS